jgi:hypothetical protein
MKIEMQKYGNLLNNRPSAKEAVLRMYQVINASGGNPSEIILDFRGVEILTPSYADEMLTQLGIKFGKDKIKTINAETEIVKATLREVENLSKHGK